MAASAALVSLKHVSDNLQLHKQQVALLTEKLTSLRTFFEGYNRHPACSPEADPVESRIADAADAAKDAIESHSIATVIEEMELIQKEAMAMEWMGMASGTESRGRAMEISPTSVRGFLQSIAYAICQKNSRYYDDLLRMIFEASSPPRAHRSDDDFPSEIFLGRDDDKRLLLSRLIWEGVVLDQADLGGAHCSVIKIVGRSGIGKTTLARAVYEEEASVKEHFDLRVWVKLEERELDLRNAAREILRSAVGMPCAVDELDELDEMVRDILQGQRCLIVFDGVGEVSKGSWLHMKQCWFDFVDLGSKVLITTTTKGDVECLLPSHEIELPPLVPSISCALASQIAVDAFRNETEKDVLCRLSATFVPGCGGFPLLLKLFGSLLRYDDKIADLLFYVNLLPFLWDESSTVLLCVWSLPPRLRQCLACCALFPNGRALSKEKTVRMWEANGVLGTGDGDACFHHLLCRSFFTDVTRDQDNNVIEFRIPSLIHGILEDVARVVYKEKMGLIGSLSEDAAEFTLISPLVEEHEPHRLQTLTLSPTICAGGTLDHSLVDFHELTSLDLSCSGIRSLSGDISVLKKLKYLNISYTLIERLPDSVTGLHSLQTLDLSRCYHLKALPEGLRDLKLMTHLDLSWCESLCCIPPGISSLRSLTSMPMFALGKDRVRSAGLQELGPLDRLEGRLEIRNLENVRGVLEAQGAKLEEKSLRRLELSWSQREEDDDDDEEEEEEDEYLCFNVLELLRPNQRLEALSLRGYAGFEFPRWIASMANLVKVSISDCGCKKLPSLWQLPSLKELQLRAMAKLKYIGLQGVADVSFPSTLERLELHDLPRLLRWFGGGGDESVLLNLKSLAVGRCPRLQSLPPLPTLRGVTVSSSRGSILRSAPDCASLVIDGTELRDMRSDQGFAALRRLVLRDIPDEYLAPLRGEMLPALEHLGIMNCSELVDVRLEGFASLRTLHLVECRGLRWITMDEKGALLREMVVEDCPQAFSCIYLHKLPCLRKLILRNCGDRFTIYNGVYTRMEKLEYLCVDGCARAERELGDYPDLISHIPVVIVGSHKAKFGGTRRGVRSSIPPLPLPRPRPRALPLPMQYSYKWRSTESSRYSGGRSSNQEILPL